MLFRGRRKTKLQYVVVGGWLPSFLEKKKSLARCLKKFDGIFVETQAMKAAMEKLGFTNVSVLPNFKRIRVLTEEELVYAEGEPYKLCTFSRVLKEKGIEDAIEAVKGANEKMGRTAYALDIYGRVDPGYEEAFAEICKTIPENIRYMESYVNKQNQNSLAIQKKLGMEIIGENRSGRSWHMQGNVDIIAKRFAESRLRIFCFPCFCDIFHSFCTYKPFRFITV
jgi:glycosyltransferase involved in cell wall biosynthesis